MRFVFSPLLGVRQKLFILIVIWFFHQLRDFPHPFTHKYMHGRSSIHVRGPSFVINYRKNNGKSSWHRSRSTWTRRATSPHEPQVGWAAWWRSAVRFSPVSWVHAEERGASVEVPGMRFLKLCFARSLMPIDRLHCAIERSSNFWSWCFKAILSISKGAGRKKI